MGADQTAKAIRPGGAKGGKFLHILQLNWSIVMEEEEDHSVEKHSDTENNDEYYSL